MNRRRVRIIGNLALATCLSLHAQPAGAQSTRPVNASPAPMAPASLAGPVATAPVGGAIRKIDAEPGEIIRRSTGTSAAQSTTRPASGATSGIETGRVMLALGIVLGMIFLMRYVGRKFFPAAAGARSSQVIRVLSRSAIAPRQQFLLVQVGRRLIVVGDSGTSMNPLAEISDPDEVAALIGQVDSEKSDSVSKAFGSIFGKARQPFESMSAYDPNLRIGNDGNENMLSPSPVRSSGANEEIAVTSARGELTGLADQVRMLARQFKGG